jgi:HD-GYP domain-containing protein (c-di-GMP phosphodiesterase class II)
MGIPEPELTDIEWGAMLHDIGKIGVPDRILLKPAKLTPEEWTIMRRHAAIGFSMLSRIDFLATAAKVVGDHHERFDGTGYPHGKVGQDIYIGARIFAVADTLDAITSDRPYRKGTSFQNAIEEIARCSGTQFDPEVVKAFLDLGETALMKIKADMVARKAAMAAAKANGSPPPAGTSSFMFATPVPSKVP